jgi:hypothetical protein
MKKLIRKMLMGDSSFTEYARVTMPDEIPQKIYLEAGGQFTEVSITHFLLCIEPIIFGIWLGKDTAPGKNYRLYFGSRDKPEAVLDLEFFNLIKDEKGSLLLLKLQQSHIYHLSAIKNFLIWYRYYSRDKMSFSKFKTHVCAYSYPRRIRIISFRQQDYYNIFPMDLLGDISLQGKYVFGLRHSNVAIKRIIETGKLLVAEVPFHQHNIIFQLGKHHSSQAPALPDLPFETTTSKNFGFPVPSFAESYKEINITQTLSLGSHMLLWGNVQDSVQLIAPGQHLYMVHFMHYLHQKNKGIVYQRL